MENLVVVTGTTSKRIGASGIVAGLAGAAAKDRSSEMAVPSLARLRVEQGIGLCKGWFNM